MVEGERQPSSSLILLLIALYVPHTIHFISTILTCFYNTITMLTAHIIAFKLKEDVDRAAARKLFERVYEFKVGPCRPHPCRPCRLAHLDPLG